MRDLRILIHTEPHPHDNPKAPYFWCILKDGKANVGSGWSESIDAAFTAAKKYLADLQV